VATGCVRAQREIDAKTNEIPELAPAIACLDLIGTVVTLDALHTQAETDSWEPATADTGSYPPIITAAERHVRPAGPHGVALREYLRVLSVAEEAGDARDDGGACQPANKDHQPGVDHQQRTPG